MTQHHPRAEKESVRELMRRTQRRYPVGMGQLARHVITHGLPAPGAVQAIGRHLAFLGFVVLGIASGVVALAFDSATPLLIWLAAAVVLTAVFVMRAGGVRRPAYYVLEWTLTSPLVVWGLLARPHVAATVDGAGCGIDGGG